jgi:hypothetical protein
MDKPKREAILDLAKYVNERIRVKFTGGREGALFYLVFRMRFRKLIDSYALLSDWSTERL